MLELLFLDFDGVLHPRYETGPTPKENCFSNLPLFELNMRQIPETHIIISSTWRLQFDLCALKSFFSSDVASRIVDITPVYPAGAPPLVAQREWEIVSWLERHNCINRNWVALDDAIWEFSKYKDRVVACNSWEGFTTKQADKLKLAMAVNAHEKR